MEYKTIKIIEDKIKLSSNEIIKVFDKIEEENKLVIDFLGKSYYCEEINSFSREDIICPNKCKSNLYYITNKYFTFDKQKQILCAKCVYCTTRLMVFQEISQE